jgi:hypothetical protein
VPEDAARALLIEAFVAEIVEDAPPGPIADALRRAVATWLGAESARSEAA